MRTPLLLLFAAAVILWGQPAVAPTRETVGSSRGENVGGYNVTNSFETGYRFRSVDGSLAKYRSDVNFGNGVRLLSSGLTVHSRDGHGRLFDEIVLNTQGLGDDPYQAATLRLQHNRWYRYDLLWRVNDYFNPGLIGGPEPAHAQDSRRQWQDHDITLFPQAALRLQAGYSRNSQSGAGLTSIQLFDSRGDEFPLFADIRRRQREYRLGAEIRLARFKFSFLRGWQRFEENTPNRLEGTSPGFNPADNTTLRSLGRREPYQGDTPFWRLHLVQESARWYSLQGRLIYAGTRRGFTFDEMSAGTDRLGAARTRQVIVAGSGRRPLTTGSLTASLFPRDNLTLTNHTAFHQIQMDGDNVYREINNTTQLPEVFRFQFLGLRSLVNTTDANYRPKPWLALAGGFHYSTRRFRSEEREQVGVFREAGSAEQTNTLRAATAGVRLQPSSPWRISLDGEFGRATRPVYPLSERNYHGLGARVQYKTRSLLVSAFTRTFYNFNSVSLFAHSARSRQYAFDLSYTARGGAAFEAGYGKLHLDTVTGVAYFLPAGLVETDRSLYISNIHTAHLGARVPLKGRADLYVGYSRVQDTGDGRTVATQPVLGGGASALSAFRAAQVWPLSFDSPQARLSVRLHSRLRLNFGYQRYQYGEDFAAVRDYRAHTGYTSLLWSF